MIFAAKSLGVRVVPVKHCFKKSFSHITTMSGGDRDLNAHFYSAASLWHQVPDTLLHMSLVVRKPVFGVSDQVRHKPGCTATEDG